MSTFGKVVEDVSKSHLDGAASTSCEATAGFNLSPHKPTSPMLANPEMYDPSQFFEDSNSSSFDNGDSTMDEDPIETIPISPIKDIERWDKLVREYTDS